MSPPEDITEIRPQEGPQERCLSSSADIVIYGGAAGGGKTFGLLMDPLRYVHNPGFGAVIFRRTYPEIKQEKGLWETASELYGAFPGGTSVNETDLKHTFKTGATIRFAHLQHEKTKYNYKSSQIAYLGFDELTSFTEGQFWYLLSRNRSVSGIKPCVRACTNPQPGWVADLIDWWIHSDDEDNEQYGYPIESRAGVLRYFARGTDDALIWGDTPDEVLQQAPHLMETEAIDPRHFVKSLTFIPATVYDNQILLQQNPEYLANLQMQAEEERDRLLGGNWLRKVSSGEVFDKSDFSVIPRGEVPSRIQWSRHWDLAGTKPTKENPNPDWTVGLLLGEKDGVVYWRDAVMMRENPDKRDRKIKNTARQDGRGVTQYVEQEPGQSGKSQVNHFARQVMKGHAVKAHRPSGSKATRWQPAAAAAGRGDILVVEGKWNDRALKHLDEVGPNDESKKDVADALAQFWDTRMTGAGTVVQSNYTTS